MTWSMPAMPLSMVASGIRSWVSLTASRLAGQGTDRGEIDALCHTETSVSARGGERDRIDAGFGPRARARQFADGRVLRPAAEPARLGAHRQFRHREAPASVGQ